MRQPLESVAALVALVVLTPLLALISVATLIDSGRPILFRQRRIGRHLKPFTMVKFRTLAVADRAAPGLFGPAGEPTRVGRVLRRTKLDELPQLLNVLRGDMQLVGPRPEVAEYVELFPHRFESLLEEPPGIVDPASLSYRAEDELLARAADPRSLYVEEILPAKLDASADYQRCRTLRSDVAVIVRTIVSPFTPRSTS